jgi:hypothetical protein
MIKYNMINILFYGNCQINTIRQTLNLNPNKYEVCNIQCYNDVDIQYFTDKIKSSDIIITQSIKDNYLDNEFLSTTYIIRTCKPDCKVIILPSYYFKFYYFDISNRNIPDQSGYNYDAMIECYKQGRSVEYYLENYVNNPHFKSKEELEQIASDCLKALDDRYNASQKYKINDNVITLPISKFIEENYKHKLLFHTPVHPTNVLIQHVCHTLIDLLNIENTMDYWTDHLSTFVRNIMYKCVEQVVNFNTPAPLIELNYEYHHNVKDITEWYYKNYAKIDQSYFL